MSKRTGQILLAALLFILPVYFGYEAGKFQDTGSALFFIKAYLDQIQKYLFQLSLTVTFAAYVFHIPFLNPIIYLRLKKNQFSILIRHYVSKMIQLSISIVLGYFIAAVLFRHTEDLFSAFTLGLWIRVLTFVLACFAIYLSVYIVSGKLVPSLGAILIINFVFLLIVYGINYYVFMGKLSEKTLLSILQIYEIIVIVGGFGLSRTTLRRRDML